MRPRAPADRARVADGGKTVSFTRRGVAGESMRRRTVALALFVAIVIPLAYGARIYFRGAAFVVQASGMEGAARTATAWYATRVTPVDLSPIPWRAGTLRARAYQPARESGRPILLVPGVHAAGIDEPRLVGFARDI